MSVQSAADQLKFGVIVSDGNNYTVEVAKEKEKVIKQRDAAYGKYHRCTVHCNCRKIYPKKQYNIKIMSRYTTKFVRSLGIDKPGNKRNHCVITKSRIQLDRIADVQSVNAYINVMEEQILKDIDDSKKSGILIKRSAKQMHKFKLNKYGHKDRGVVSRSTNIHSMFALLRLSECQNESNDSRENHDQDV